MKLSKAVKPISYMKAHASEMVNELHEEGGTYVITHGGKACAVLQDIATYEQTQETMAMLKIVAMGREEIAAGKYQPLDEAVSALRKELGIGRVSR